MAKEQKATKCSEKSCNSCSSSKPLTKTQLIQALAEATGLSKKDVTSVVEQLSVLIKIELDKGDKTSFTLPGLLKIEKQYVPAKPAQTNVPDPFHPGKTVDRPAKEARYKIKLRALKGLKEMV